MSEAEDLLAFQLKAAGLKGFVRQYRYAPPRKLRADFAFLLPPPSSLLVWCDGGVYARQAHGSRTGILKDMERANEAAFNRWYTILVTPQMIKNGVALSIIERFFKGL